LESWKENFLSNSSEGNFDLGGSPIHLNLGEELFQVTFYGSLNWKEVLVKQQELFTCFPFKGELLELYALENQFYEFYNKFVLLHT
jgi:hypothetical protein